MKRKLERSRKQYHAVSVLPTTLPRSLEAKGCKLSRILFGLALKKSFPVDPSQFSLAMAISGVILVVLVVLLLLLLRGCVVVAEAAMGRVGATRQTEEAAAGLGATVVVVLLLDGGQSRGGRGSCRGSCRSRSCFVFT